jgi:hypothetical protein
MVCRWYYEGLSFANPFDSSAALVGGVCVQI